MSHTIIKEKDGSLSMFEITINNEIILSGKNWREKKSKADKLPMYGTCKTGRFKSKEEAEEVLKEIIKLVT